MILATLLALFSRVRSNADLTRLEITLFERLIWRINRWMETLGIAGLFGSFLVGCVVGVALSSESLHAARGALQSWQELLAGLVAILAAIIGAMAVYRSTRTQIHHEKRKTMTPVIKKMEAELTKWGYGTYHLQRSNRWPQRRTAKHFQYNLQNAVKAFGWDDEDSKRQSDERVARIAEMMRRDGFFRLANSFELTNQVTKDLLAITKILKHLEDDLVYQHFRLRRILEKWAAQYLDGEVDTDLALKPELFRKTQNSTYMVVMKAARERTRTAVEDIKNVKH